MDNYNFENKVKELGDRGYFTILIVAVHSFTFIYNYLMNIIKRNNRLELFLKCKIKNVQTHSYISSFIDDIITLFSYFSKNDLKPIKSSCLNFMH